MQIFGAEINACVFASNKFLKQFSCSPTKTCCLIHMLQLEPKRNQ